MDFKTYYTQAQNIDDVNEQIKLLTKAIAIASETELKVVDAFLLRGEAHYKTGMYDKAIADSNEAEKLLNLHHKDRDGVNKRFATVCYINGMASFEIYRRKYPNRWKEKIWYEYDVYEAIDDMEDILQAFDESVSFDPTFWKAYAERAIVKEYKAEYRKAIEDYNIAIEIDSSHDMLYYNRGNQYYRLQQFEDAMQDYLKAIELNPKVDSYFTNLGVVYQIMAQIPQFSYISDKLPAIIPETDFIRKAIENFSKALNLNPKAGIALHYRGLLYIFIGNYKLANEDFTQAAEFGDSQANKLLEKLRK